MSTKEAVLDLVRKLPDNCSLDDIQYHLYVLQTIERGRADVAQGNTVSHEQVKRELREKWLKHGVK
jgi:predicted transcriptional regulator